MSAFFPLIPEQVNTKLTLQKRASILGSGKKTPLEKGKKVERCRVSARSITKRERREVTQQHSD
jgi:hypothetical protein